MSSFVGASGLGETEAVYRLGRFAFENGGEIPDMKVGYVTWGALNAARSNAILLVPGTSGTRHSYDAHIGPGKTYDTDKYFVIGADPIGGGTSSQPKDGLGTAFPRYTIRDMVRAQQAMVTKGLGISKLFAVGGSSMGSFQTVEWGINFPGVMRGLIMLVPAARSDNHFAAVVDAFEAMITLDPAYQGGRYTVNPEEGIRRAALIYFPWMSSDEYLISLDDKAYEAAKQAAGERWVKEWDANSMLWRYFASRGHDASKPFGGDMMKALGMIKAPALLLPSMTDRTIPGYLTRELHRGLRGQVVYAEIPSIRGHSASGAVPGTAEYAYVSQKIRGFLGGLGE
ncbi:MAG: alpha/beta fold hydrolase [Acetobacteraceae bacterium]|nr:alpha/beta fold hydrolase [Acetobacteraceae bacterium]